MKKILVLGASGSIGSYLTKNLSNDLGVIATTRLDCTLFENNQNVSSHQVDFNQKEDIYRFFKSIKDIDNIYGIVNCYGVQSPIGSFKNTDFKIWENNLNTNFNNYAYLLHLFLNSNHSLKKVINFSGGGCTFPRKYFSAYSISKISLYKFTEILALEYKDEGIDFNIIAPGAIKSKMTQEVIDIGKDIGDEYSEAVNTLNSGGQDKVKILELCQLLLSKKSNGLSGRLFAAQWDCLNNYDMNELINNKNLFSLKRIDNKNFIEKNKL
tara:strand:- start:2653 stop:3456 length:804 start_codon:yes stop_codon:yes gene_type:complete